MMGSSEALRFASCLGIGETDFLRALRAQESAAVTVVIKEYTPVLYRTAVGFGLAADHADEVVQLTWTGFFNALPRFEGRSQIKTFLTAILVNKVRELRRSQAKTGASASIEAVCDSQFDAEGNWNTRPIEPEQFYQATQTLNHLNECLEDLAETHRMALLLREWEERPKAEICNILAVSETNLRVMVHRAKTKLRECLEEKAFAPIGL